MIVNDVVDVDVGDAVLVLTFDPEHPVFHASRYEQLRFDLDDDGRAEVTTRCGIAHRATPLPSRHAVTFARPCRRCWRSLIGATR